MRTSLLGCLADGLGMPSFLYVVRDRFRHYRDNDNFAKIG
jgi:hypothetical protein